MNQKSPRNHFLPGNKYLLPYLAFLSAFAPLSTDMYLPALPSMTAALHASNELVSASISIFLLFFALSMLIWGPLSDKYGRKPVLAAGSILYILSSIIIAVSDSIMSILVWRVIQAAGSGAASSIVLAIVKDLFRGKSMEKIVSIIQAATILAPMAAPVAGGVLLYVLNWRGIFWCLALCGVISLAGALCIKETAPHKSEITLFSTFVRIGIVLKNPGFSRLLIIFSSMAMPFMAYLGVCAFIYQDYFHLSPQGFSLFFAFNALMSLFGPVLFLAHFSHYNRNRLVSVLIGLMIIFGLLVTITGNANQWWFALLFAGITFCGSTLRPPSTVMMMESIKGDNGVVAALINCGGLFCGSLAMFIAAMPFWPNPVLAVGIIALSVSALAFAGWLGFRKKIAS